MIYFKRALPFCVVVGFLVGCSSSTLRKFEEGDISKEISADIAKKFEVKEIGSVTPTPAPKPVRKRKKKSSTGKMKNTPQEPATPPSRRVEPMPFAIGEKLSYDIRYIGVTAGTFELELLPLKLMGNRSVYTISGHARTVKLFELVYRVNDLIQSFWDYDGLFSHKFTMDLDESKQSRKLIELYDYEKGKSFYWNRVDHSEKGLSEQKESFDIKPWSQDLLSSLYYLRTIKHPVPAGQAFRFPVILDGKPWETVIRYLRTEKIYAGGKDREAWVYQIENIQDGVVKNKDNTIWISTDEHRYILRIEAKVKVGSFAVALDKIL